MKAYDKTFQEDWRREPTVTKEEALHVLERIDTPNILDVGCGCGWTTKYLSDASEKKVVGLDVSQVGLGFARNKFPECEFVEGNFLGMPIEIDSSWTMVGFELSAYNLGEVLSGNCVKWTRVLLKHTPHLIIVKYIWIPATRPRYLGDDVMKKMKTVLRTFNAEVEHFGDCIYAYIGC